MLDIPGNTDDFGAWAEGASQIRRLSKGGGEASMGAGESENGPPVDEAQRREA